MDVFFICLGARHRRESQTKGTDDARFTKIVVPTGGDPDAIAAADVNHDGAMDIIAANLEQGTVSVLLGDRKGHFHHSPGSPFPARTAERHWDWRFQPRRSSRSVDCQYSDAVRHVAAWRWHGKVSTPAPHSPFATRRDAASTWFSCRTFLRGEGRTARCRHR